MKGEWFIEVGTDDACWDVYQLALVARGPYSLYPVEGYGIIRQ